MLPDVLGIGGLKKSDASGGGSKKDEGSGPGSEGCRFGGLPGFDPRPPFGEAPFLPFDLLAPLFFASLAYEDAFDGVASARAV